MINPFEYGTVVSENSFCNRKAELTEVRRVMENAGRAFLYSERRYGKTSLVTMALRQLSQRAFIGIYIDVLPTDGPVSFIKTVAGAISNSLDSRADKALEIAKSIFQRLTPVLTVDDEGKPMITFGINRQTSVTPELQEVLGAPAKIAANKQKTVVVVFDDIQQIMEYGGDVVERMIRSVIQHQKNVSYIFLGSRKHLVHKMFLDKHRPLYRSASHLTLRAIEKKEWIPFIQKGFRNSGKRIDSNCIGKIHDLTQGHPFYTQQLCHILWETCEPGKAVSEDLLTEAMRTLFKRENYAYTLLWESLTKNQQRFVIGLASEREGVKPFASQFLRRYRLGSPSSAQRAVQALVARDIIDNDNGSFVILDRFLRSWLQETRIARDAALS